MSLRRIAAVIAGIIVIAGVCLFLLPKKDVKQVEYITHHGSHPTPVEMTFVAPTSNLSTVPLTSVHSEFGTDELLSIEGSLVKKNNEVAKPIIVKFVKHRSDGTDIVGNSAVKIPDSGSNKIQILVNCPKQEGDYDLQICWGGDAELIARAKVVVKEKR